MPNVRKRAGSASGGTYGSPSGRCPVAVDDPLRTRGKRSRSQLRPACFALGINGRYGNEDPSQDDDSGRARLFLARWQGMRRLDTVAGR